MAANVIKNMSFMRKSTNIYLILDRKCFSSVVNCSRLCSTDVRSSESPIEDNDSEKSEELRDISGLPKHLKRQMKHVNIAPDMENLKWNPKSNHASFHRSLYARFGKKSGIEAGVMWPTREALQDLKEDERNYEPTLDAMLTEIQNEKAQIAEMRRQKEELVEKQMERMPKYIAELQAKQKKREAEEQKAVGKRQILLDEAREFFGYTIDIKDPRFMQMQELKEEEEKKQKKKRKKEEKQAKLLQHFQKTPKDS